LGANRATDPSAPDRPYIGVIGAGEAAQMQLTTAESGGREFARRGAIVVCGGRRG
jgi:predicted Rossmann-fold nucleotide-binding protein